MRATALASFGVAAWPNTSIPMPPSKAGTLIFMVVTRIPTSDELQCSAWSRATRRFKSRFEKANPMRITQPKNAAVIVYVGHHYILVDPDVGAHQSNCRKTPMRRCRM